MCQELLDPRYKVPLTASYDCTVSVIRLHNDDSSDGENLTPLKIIKNQGDQVLSVYIVGKPDSSLVG